MRAASVNERIRTAVSVMCKRKQTKQTFPAVLNNCMQGNYIETAVLLFIKIVPSTQKQTKKAVMYFYSHTVSQHLIIAELN